MLLNGSPKVYLLPRIEVRRSSFFDVVCYSPGSIDGMLNVANQGRLFTGFIIENLALEVSHLQFADDTIIFCDAKLEEIENVIPILCWF